ncbi:MAG: DsbC family protein [Smithellaceae bacterium]|jgi:thiol:disulfide interchange protein DsbC
MKKLVLIVLCLLLIIPVCAGAKNLSSEDKFKKSFPKNNFESIKPTSIKGVYEIYDGNQIYYFMPEAEVIIYGNIISKNGVNITRESNLKKIAAKMANLPLDSALKIGNGKTPVIEFMDPDCSYCRQAYNFFSQRQDVTIYVFFSPSFQNSEKKIRHILCAPDKLKMYEEVLTGKFDNNAPLNICTDKKVDETVKTHIRLSSQIGIRSIPLFFIKGQVIVGFEKAIIENILKD